LLWRAGPLASKVSHESSKGATTALLTELRPTCQPVGYQTSGQFSRPANQKLGIMVSDVTTNSVIESRPAFNGKLVATD